MQLVIHDEVVLPLNARLPDYLSKPICKLLRVARDGPFKKIGIPFLATRALHTEATLSREHSVHVVLILQHLSSSTETCEVVLPLNARSPDFP